MTGPSLDKWGLGCFLISKFDLRVVLNGPGDFQIVLAVIAGRSYDPKCPNPTHLGFRRSLSHKAGKAPQNPRQATACTDGLGEQTNHQVTCMHS